MSDPTVAELQKQIDELKAQNAEIIAESKKYRIRAQTSEEQVKTEAQKAADAQAKLDEAEAQRKKLELEGKGKYDEALKQQQEDHRKALEAATARATAAETALQGAVGQTALLTALGKAGLKPELIGQASRLVAGQVKVQLTDGQAVVQVLDDAGKPMLKTDGTPAGLEDLAASFAQANPHFLPPSGDTGTGAHRGAGGKTTATLAELDASPALKTQFIKDHGEPAYFELVKANLANKRKG
jgi:myosin heavy subunit